MDEYNATESQYKFIVLGSTIKLIIDMLSRCIPRVGSLTSLDCCVLPRTYFLVKKIISGGPRVGICY